MRNTDVYTGTVGNFMETHKEVTDYTVNDRCSKCGGCCPSTLLMFPEEIKKIKAYVKKNGIKPHVVGIPLADKAVDMTCPFLNSRHECNIYEVRPLICKAFQCNQSQERTINKMIEMRKGKKTNDTVRVTMREEFF